MWCEGGAISFLPTPTLALDRGWSQAGGGAKLGVEPSRALWGSFQSLAGGDERWFADRTRALIPVKLWAQGDRNYRSNGRGRETRAI